MMTTSMTAEQAKKRSSGERGGGKKWKSRHAIDTQEENESG
jgi:hypothetical protein